MNPLKILVVAHMYGTDFGANYYMIMPRLLHGFVRNGHAVQVFNDRDVARLSTVFRSRKFGAARMNKRLLETCENYRPDMVLLGHCEMVWNATIERIRARLPGTKIIYRNVDPLHDEPNRRRIERRAGVVDGIFLTTAGEESRRFARGRTFVAFMPNPVDPAIDTGSSFAASDQDHDLFFGIGSVYENDPRLAIATRLRQALPAFAFDFRGMFGRPSVRGAAYLDLLANARMGLSFSRVNDRYLYASDRMAQYMGNGLLTFVDRRTGFDEIFGEDEVAFYDGFEELVEKLTYYRNNDDKRKRVARSGWEKSQSIFNCRHVARYLVEQSLQDALSPGYSWPTQRHAV